MHRLRRSFLVVSALTSSTGCPDTTVVRCGDDGDCPASLSSCVAGLCEVPGDESGAGNEGEGDGGVEGEGDGGVEGEGDGGAEGEGDGGVEGEGDGGVEGEGEGEGPLPAGVENIVTSGRVGERVAIAVDSAGRPHVVLSGPDEVDLIYAVRRDDAWQVTPIEIGDDVVRAFDIAIDSADVVHLAWARGSELEHGFGASPSFVVEPIASDSANRSIALTIDPLVDEPIVVDVASAGGSRFPARYVARSTSGNWLAPEELSAASDADVRHVAMVTRGREQRIAWIDDRGPSLQTAKLGASGFEFELVADFLVESHPVAIAIDDDDRSLVAFTTGPSIGGSLNLQRQEPSGLWSERNIENGSLMIAPSLAVAPDGALLIAWRSGNTRALRIGRGSFDAGFTTTTLPVSPAATLDVAVDGDGVAHLTWQNDDREDVLYQSGL